MPTLSKPINIPGPWAYNGDKNTIPDTGADVGLASWAQGWGLVNQLPLTAGGIPPARADFNGALNALSAHVYYQQSGAYYDWSADLMYPFPARVLGSDGKVYDWVSASGVGTSAGAQDPTTDNDRTWWTPAVTGGDLPEFDGTTIKLINGKYGVPEFTAPTASAPGKAGLVPGPGASSYPENVILTAGLFKEVDLAFMHGSAESVELNKTRLGLGGVTAEGVNIDTLTRGGIFTSNTFGGTLPEGVTGGVLVNIMSLGNDGLYYGQQILISYINNRLYFRGNIFGIQPGGTVNWNPWSCLTPIPQAAAGVGQWKLIWNGNTGGPNISLPDGGVWSYFIIGGHVSGIIISSDAGVAGGGTLLTLTNNDGMPISSISGVVWRVA